MSVTVGVLVIMTDQKVHCVFVAIWSVLGIVVVDVGMGSCSYAQYRQLKINALCITKPFR